MRSCNKLARYAAVETRNPGQISSVTEQPPTNSRRSETTACAPGAGKKARVPRPLGAPPKNIPSIRFGAKKEGKLPAPPRKARDARGGRGEEIVGGRPGPGEGPGGHTAG